MPVKKLKPLSSENHSADPQNNKLSWREQERKRKIGKGGGCAENLRDEGKVKAVKQHGSGKQARNNIRINAVKLSPGLIIRPHFSTPTQYLIPFQ